MSSYKCDRPSHPDWGHLGVVRAAGVDNRWQGHVVLFEGHTLAPCQRKPPAKLGSINIQGVPIKNNPLGKFIISVTVTDFSPNLHLSQKRIQATYTANFGRIFAMV